MIRSLRAWQSNTPALAAAVGVHHRQTLITAPSAAAIARITNW